MFEPCLIRQHEPEPEAEVWIGDGPDPTPDALADRRTAVLGQAKLLKRGNVRGQVATAGASQTCSAIWLRRVAPPLIARRIEK